MENVRLMNCSKKQSTRRGQTIIEVLVAFGLLTTIAVGSYSLLFTGMKFAIATREETQAVALVTYVMNQKLSLANKSYPMPYIKDVDFYTNPTKNPFLMIETGYYNNTIYVSSTLLPLEEVTRDNGDWQEPGYGVTKDGEPAFMRLEIKARVLRTETIYVDSRVVRIR